MDRDELVRYLDAYLRIQDFPQDPSLNGLQVEGKRTVRKVGAAVDAGEAIFRKALEEEVDFLIVHHGLFWESPSPSWATTSAAWRPSSKGDQPLRRPPAPGRPRGGGQQLRPGPGARACGPHALGRGGERALPPAHPLLQVADRLGQLTGMQPLVHQGGLDHVETVILVSGSGTGLLPKVDADLFVTGEPKHSVFHETFERGLNVIYAGHYDTETFGVKALAAHPEARFGLPWVFLDHPTGL